MYHDSDDEPLSGDDEEEKNGDDQRNRRQRQQRRHRSLEIGNRESSTRDVGENSRGVTERTRRNTKRKTTTTDFGGLDVRPVIVVDYDLTLVDRTSRPFPGAHDFLEKLRGYNDGRNQLILYSHGSPAYIEDGLDKHFPNERGYFDEIISDSSARDNKPISHVRRVIKDMRYLAGPYVIIDDMRSNLDSDQYDVVIDVTRMTKYGENGRAVSVDYGSCLCMVDRGVREFLATKTKRKRQR